MNGYTSCDGCGRLFAQSEAELHVLEYHDCDWSDDRLNKEIASQSAFYSPDTDKMDWSVWANNQITGTWTFEFEGTREQCLRYLDVATDRGSRLWEFSIRRPTEG